MNLNSLQMGQSFLVSHKTHAIVTDRQFIDPLSYQKILVDDLVSVKSPGGAIVDFRVLNITDDNGLVLGPPHRKMSAQVNVVPQTIVITGDFYDPKSSFRAKRNDLVAVTDKNKRTVKLKVTNVIDNKFILLTPPEIKKISLISLLKSLWGLL